MKPQIKLAFLSGTPDLNRELIVRVRGLFPELPVWVVSDFPPEDSALPWIRYRARRSFADNLQRVRDAVRGYEIRLAAVMLVPNVPFRRMRAVALALSPRAFIAFNEHLHHFMLRPAQIPTILRHVLWRAKNTVRWLRTRDWPGLYHYMSATIASWVRPRLSSIRGESSTALAPGITVVIPSRTGRDLLAAQLPAILAEGSGQIVIVDNGSTDDTAAWLAATYPTIEVDHSSAALSFARAVNRGIARTRHTHVCLLNNDMSIEPGFFAALRRPFDRIPELFCTTAQIRFPAGQRREETGKTVFAQSNPEDFPVRCDEPLPGEDGTWVLYGSGGCSLFDTAKLAALGNLDETYEPAYVEDLDIGYRAWQRGWPSVYVAGAIVEHRHRATTSRYYTEAELDEILERNYLRFVARAVSKPAVFRRLWRQALRRLLLRRAATAGRVSEDTSALSVASSLPQDVAGSLSPGAAGSVSRDAPDSRPAAGSPLRAAGIGNRRRFRRGMLHLAAPIALAGSPAPRQTADENLFLALTNGTVSVFPGRAATGKPRVVIASPYLPFPLSHGGAVRMYNLMRRAAADCDQILVAFTEHPATPPPELADLFSEIVLVHRPGAHDLPATSRPETVEEFASPSFRAALRETMRKWRPAVAQLEFTQMAQYASECAPARTILVEHDITFDLAEQLLRLNDTRELRREVLLWRRFETSAWRSVDRVVVMSEKDRAMVSGATAVVLPNGVDPDRFRPAANSPEACRVLFIGSFAHRPNVMAVEWFVNAVFPRLRNTTLHIIAGARHERFPVAADLTQAGIELEGFVADVRPAYERATVVVAPLTASAGTNIKVLEAMAMGKAVVSTPAGVNGLDLSPGEDFLLAGSADEMVSAMEDLFRNAEGRARIQRAARARVERDFNWDTIARAQGCLYDEIK